MAHRGFDDPETFALGDVLSSPDRGGDRKIRGAQAALVIDGHDAASGERPGISDDACTGGHHRCVRRGRQIEAPVARQPPLGGRGETT
jgi:hypothetical protein